MTNEPSPRPWRVEPMFNGVADARGEKVAANICPADAALIVDAVNTIAEFEAARMEFPDFRPVIIAAGQRDAAIDERDRLRSVLEEVCSRVSVALNCQKQEYGGRIEIELLVHDLIGIKQCASAALGEDKE